MRVYTLLIALPFFIPGNAVADKLSAGKVVDKAVEAAADEMIDQAEDEFEERTGYDLDGGKDHKKFKKNTKLKVKNGKYRSELERERESHGEHVSYAARDDDREHGESLSEEARDKDDSDEKRWWEFWKD